MQKEQFIRELEREAKSARLMMERLPADHFEWRPYPKSRTLADLAWHMVSIPGLVPRVAQQGVQERTKVVWPQRPDTATAMLAGFDASVATGSSELATLDDAVLARPFRMMNGTAELFAMSAGEFIRWGMLTHFVHHRAQLGLYLRILDIEVPAMIGPSLDDMTFLR